MTGDGLRRSRAGLLGGIYGRVTQARRAWYGRRADRRRRLHHPVISVGNLASGGSGKTPVVAAIARMLRERGERPAILSRGYGRRERVEGVLVVSDGERVLEPVTRSGDEPQMLARALSGIPVLVSPDRYVAGSFAERRFGATVCLLDDGFQHVQLERDIDLLLVAPRDLQERMLPWGPLREPLDAARFADGLLVAGTDDEVTEVARALGHERAFRVAPRYADPQGPRRTLPSGPPERALAFAGIARPERFYAALRSLGWDVARELTFRDHHWFTPRDLLSIEGAARDAGASVIITTEKDAVRLPAFARQSSDELRRGERSARQNSDELRRGEPSNIPIVVLPMTVEIEPAEVFESWLLDRLRRARG